MGCIMVTFRQNVIKNRDIERYLDLMKIAVELKT